MLLRFEVIKYSSAMNSPRYQVVPHPISTILTWVKSKEIAIPEIQRPFVWDSSQVRDLLDSLYKGYPVGYLISWSNPTVRLKDGGTAAGKRILIDGQQRVTALMASLLGITIINKDYETTRIKIAFNPIEEKFEVFNPVIAKSKEWIPDISELFGLDFNMLKQVRAYKDRNTGVDEERIYNIFDRLKKIENNMVGVIELSNDLDIETVTEIFIRVNSQGTQLSQADFAMSKIAANETYQGNVLRKAIDYFCHLAIAPEFIQTIETKDQEFTKTDYFSKMKWMAKDKENLYDPSYTDMLRVAFTSEFGRGRLQDLVALLSGRNFETKEYEDVIAEQSFASLKKGILNFMNETQFQKFVMIIKSAGLIDASLIGSQSVIDFAFIVYLHGRSEGMNQAVLETLTRQWLIMPMLTGRYSGQPESAFDQDIRQIRSIGLAEYTKVVIETELSESFWTLFLPQQLQTSSTTSPSWNVFCATQSALFDKGFLSSDILVRTLIQNKGDVHHIYPKNYLQKHGLSKTKYNQIANYAHTQSEINITIGDKAPGVYMAEIREQVAGGPLKYGGITSLEILKENFVTNCIPLQILEAGEMPYEEFMNERRVLMAARMREHFLGLGNVNSEN
jgi:uncharacterized protein with ParB-like and HNH nuclease domain